MRTHGLAGWVAFTRRGWSNPDFKPEFLDTQVIRVLSRWCLVGVSGLKGFARRSSSPKVRRVGRSTQTHLDADRRPLCAERTRARQRQHGGAVAAMAGPR